MVPSRLIVPRDIQPKPATAAMEKAFSVLNRPPFPRKRKFVDDSATQKAETSFDIDDLFIEASCIAGDFLSFPSIEWTFNDRDLVRDDHDYKKPREESSQSIATTNRDSDDLRRHARMLKKRRTFTCLRTDTWVESVERNPSWATLFVVEAYQSLNTCR